MIIVDMVYSTKRTSQEVTDLHVLIQWAEHVLHPNFFSSFDQNIEAFL